MLLQRAYSTLEVKSVDVDGFTISGVASTPTPDRMGDIVEPKGITFKNPVPLLLFHDSSRPVGTVKFDKPTEDGLTFTAKLVDPAKVTSAALRERIEEAWDSIKAKLIRGVSIGFRPLEDGIEFLRETGGLRFTDTEVLELSLVTIPANSEATITTIKSIDAAHLAALGERQPSSTAPGASGSSRARGRSTMKTISERIAAFRAEKQTKAARLNELVTPTDDGSTRDEAEQQEFENIKVELKSLDDEISRLEYVEQMNKSMATPVAGNTPAAAAASRNPNPVITVRQNVPASIEFTRAVLCKTAAFLEQRTGNLVSALDVAKQRYPDNPRVHEYIKGTVLPAQTGNSAFLGALVDPTNLASEFIDFLRPMTIIGKFGQGGIPALNQVPFNIRVIGQTSEADAYWVGQGKPKPLTQFGVEPVTLTWAKIATIIALTQEQARFSSPSAETLARNAIVAAVVKRADIDFIDPDKSESAGVSPASITNGISALDSSGADADDVRTDLANLLNEFVDADNPVSDIVLIMPAGLALTLSLMVNALGQPEFPTMTKTGGSIVGIPVIASNYAGRFTGHGNIVIAVNPNEIFLSDDGQVTVDVSTEASLEMTNTPSQDGSAGTGAQLVSLWQNNLIALRAERFINWKRRRTTAVAWMDDVAWGSIGSPSLP
jgi:HK97 family phage major capsid protein/HK97 family phage prohead protease